jgi:ADP-ribose pyrophosphatase YjhB (NUDIX family)
MLHNSEINPIQVAILRKLSKGEKFRFSEIRLPDVPSDHFSYHLRQLLRAGLIIKHDDGTYGLSVLGKSQTQLISPETNRYKAQGFVAVRLVLSKQENGQEFFLLQERADIPFQGMLLTPGGKIPFGKTIEAAARYYMEYETGLLCDVTLRGCTHFIDEYEREVVQDRYFFVFQATNPKGKLLRHGPNGKNTWLTREEIERSPQSLEGLVSIIDMACRPNLSFNENTFEVQKF